MIKTGELFYKMIKDTWNWIMTEAGRCKSFQNVYTNLLTIFKVLKK